ncbi:MAG TPA: outer membrane beta-barrel protein [Paludibacteraceae bacterium]|nr:outer membrane beta-barrel protein [Paludibacteraceae bacterium]HQB68508.1 outer membrane beta-barrel protein [Paludibacteraceae bacterium]
MKRIFIILTLFVGFSLGVGAQDNLPMVDYKTLHFGFALGTNIMDFGFTQSQQEIDGKVYNVDVSMVMPGFMVGVLGDVRLSNNLNFRLIPALHLADRTISYSNNVDDEIIRTSVKSTIISVPAYIKFSAPRINNYRPYLIAGGGVMFDMAGDRQMPVLLKSTDYFIDFGVGCTFYFSFFRFSPEIKFALGFNDMLVPWSERPDDVLLPADRKYSDAISRLTSRMLTICLNFE